MTKLDLLSVGLASFGSIAVLGITTAPTQAVGIQGALEWNGGTDNFISGIVFTPTNVFSAEFSPEGIATSFGASGDFVAPGLFDMIPGTYGLDPITGVFSYLDATPVGFEYELVGDLALSFDNGVTKTLPDGAVFLGRMGPEGSVQFELERGQWISSIPGFYDTVATSSTFEFGQAPEANFGEYIAQNVDAPNVPEPGTIIGLLAVGGLGLGLKHKKQL